MSLAHALKRSSATLTAVWPNGRTATSSRQILVPESCKSWATISILSSIYIGENHMDQRIFSGIYPAGIVYADRTRQKGGDYARLAFLPYEIGRASCRERVCQYG